MALQSKFRLLRHASRPFTLRSILTLLLLFPSQNTRIKADATLNHPKRVKAVKGKMVISLQLQPRVPSVCSMQTMWCLLCFDSSLASAACVDMEQGHQYTSCMHLPRKISTPSAWCRAQSCLLHDKGPVSPQSSLSRLSAYSLVSLFASSLLF